MFNLSIITGWYSLPVFSTRHLCFKSLRHSDVCLKMFSKLCFSFAYRCDCNPGWEGRHCELRVDYCKSNPCVNAVRCSNGNTAPICVCREVDMLILNDTLFDFTVLFPILTDSEMLSTIV